jgi:hypothetical protein
LRNHADTRLSRVAFAVEIVAEYADRATSLTDERGNDSDCCRFSCAVWTQERKKIALINNEIDPLQGFEAVGVDLAQLIDNKRVQRVAPLCFTVRQDFGRLIRRSKSSNNCVYT